MKLLTNHKNREIFGGGIFWEGGTNSEVKRACSVKDSCTKIARILRTVVQTGANMAVF